MDIDEAANLFMEMAVQDMIQTGEHELACPYRRIKNTLFVNPFRGTLMVHLLRFGSMECYTWLPNHGD